MHCVRVPSGKDIAMGGILLGIVCISIGLFIGKYYV